MKTMTSMEIQTNDLYHHGIKGMKWGVRRTKAELGYPESSPRKKTPLNSKKKQQHKKLRELSKIEQERIKNKRKEILNSPSKLYKYRDQFTEQEIKDAIKRFETNKRLSELSNYEVNAGKRYVENVVGYVETGIKVYNTLTKVNKIVKGTYKEEDDNKDKKNKKKGKND